jgi:dipeptidyl aminopeptidase/acylaminoacyl peptidase
MALRMCHCAFLLVMVLFAVQTWGQAPQEQAVADLAKAVAGKGWICYGARAESGSWDLFLMRPDGSRKRNITNTPDFEEAAPRFSSDGTRLLYRRLPKGATINHDRWGFQGRLILANADGSNPTPQGDDGELTWASWSPDGKQISCLTKKGIDIVDLAARRVVRKMPRKGVYQQLYWSPDGKWFCGVANHQGESWTVVRLNAESAALNPVRSFQNCTPDWFPDSNRIILSSRPAGQPANDGQGYTQLWMVSGDGSEQRLVYGEDGFHIYGGLVSPDSQYVMFTRGPKDGSGADKAGAPICIMRLSDAPSIGGPSADLRKVHPNTKDGPVLTLETGWEPHWTYAEIGAKP